MSAITSNLKRKALATAIGVVVTFAALSPLQGHAATALQNQMQDMFGSMANSTSPGAFETARRGVISGGSVTVRNKIMNTSIVSWTPPSFNAGCGGIDMFGGSFSFINKDQFIQLARSIASNAASYAFYLALGAMSEKVSAIIDNIQKKIQALNEFFGNSCQLAQGIVNDTAAAMGYKADQDGAKAKSLIGGFSDIFDTFTDASGDGTTNNIPESALHYVQGNFVWNALKEHNVGEWFDYGGSSLHEAIMSATGTVIIGEATETDEAGLGDTRPISYPPKILSLKNLIEGGDVEIYACSDTDDCLTLKDNQTISLTGFQELIVNELLGSDGSSGIISKIRAGTTLSSDEQAFIANLPSSMGSMIFRLTRLSESVTKNFVQEISEPLGREMAYTLVISFIDAALAATSNFDGENAYAPEAIKTLQASRKEHVDDYQSLIASGMKLSDAMKHYNNILEAAANSEIMPSYISAESITATSSN